MSRLVRRLFARVFDAPRPRPRVYRAAHLRARFMVQALEGRVVPAAFSVTNANNSGAGSLRQAILDANANPDADTITFDPTFFATPRTVTLTSGSLDVTESVTITGPGASRLTVSGNNASRVFNIANANSTLTVSLSGLTVSGGMVNNGDGAGIFISNESVTITDSVITGNTIPGTNQSYSGGGVATAGGGSLTIRNTTVSGNTSSGRGAGIYVTG